MTKETYEEYKIRRDAENCARQTVPPTQLTSTLGDDDAVWVDYPDGTKVQWVCSCGNPEFQVFYIAGNYTTAVECTKCNKYEEVHTG